MAGARQLHHVNILVEDRDAGVAFYRDAVEMAPDDSSDHRFPSQSFTFLNECPFPAHSCIAADDSNETFRRPRYIAIIDVGPWGKVRMVPTGSTQLFTRAPSGNQLKILSRPGDVIDDHIPAAPSVSVSNDNRLYQSVGNERRRGAS